MCRRVDGGYEMADGTIIPFGNLDISKLDPNHIQQMYKAPSSALDSFILYGKLENIETAILQKIGDHSAGCPQNIPEIEKIVDQKIGSYPIRWLQKKSKPAKAITAILMLIGAVFTLITHIKAWLK